MRCATAVFALLLALTKVQAADVYALQGTAVGPPIDACRLYGWRGSILLRNGGTADATVTLIGFGTAPLPGARPDVRIPIGKTIATTFIPGPQMPTLWVVHLDVPDDVTIESRIEITTEFCAGPPRSFPDRGKLSFPVYRALQPANVTKVHLGTDLASTDARNNVAVFNAGTDTAKARVEVHRACDDQVIDARDVPVAPSAVVQVTGLSAITGTACLGGTASVPLYITYVTVVVDQPSLSWVSTLANDKQISVVYGINSSSP